MLHVTLYVLYLSSFSAVCTVIFHRLKMSFRKLWEQVD